MSKKLFEGLFNLLHVSDWYLLSAESLQIARSLKPYCVSAIHLTLHREGICASFHRYLGFSFRSIIILEQEYCLPEF